MENLNNPKSTPPNGQVSSKYVNKKLNAYPKEVISE
jgi:hypothetical protein